MRGISSSDNVFPEHILPDTTASTSGTLHLDPHGRSNSTCSMPSVSTGPFVTIGRHRLLPEIPTSHTHRPSSPKFLTTPTLLSSGSANTLSADTGSDSSLYCWNLKHRSTATGRRLPQTPSHDDSVQLIAKSNVSGTDNSDSISSKSDIADNDWPSPTIIQRKFSELRTDNHSTSTLFGNIASGTSLRSLQRLPFLKRRQSRQQEQLEVKFNQQFSLDNSGGPSTSVNVYSPSSSLSPSVEQLTDEKRGDDQVRRGSDYSSPCLHDVASSCSSVSDIAKQSAVRTSSSWPDNESKPSGLGLIHCSVQHFPIRKRLRVSLLKAEGLAGKLKPELEVHAFCKVSLIPGGKSQNSVVKRGRDVVFNQEFFFDNVLVEDLSEKLLVITVYHQSSQKLQKDVLIGDLNVSLKSLNELRSKKEVKIVKELNYHKNSKKLGKLHITSCLEKNANRLTINIIKVEDLPKGGITGPPDVCVRARLTQNNVTQTKQSRIIKGTCNATFKEAIMFLVKTKSSDLENTSVVISVHDLSRTTAGDDLIGSVCLGKSAIDKSAQEQWKNTMEHIGKEFKAAHQLKARLEAPNVHVTEATSDSEIRKNPKLAQISSLSEKVGE